MITEHDDGAPPNSRGLNRRSMLRKAAVGGAIAWTAPTVLSSTAGAQDDACTPKCVQQPALTVSGSGTTECIEGDVQGFFVDSANVTAASTCPCGGDLQIDVIDPDFSFGPVRFNVNDGAAMFQVSALTYCVDRGGTSIEVGCATDITVTTGSSCDGSVRFDFGGTLECFGPQGCPNL